MRRESEVGDGPLEQRFDRRLVLRLWPRRLVGLPAAHRASVDGDPQPDRPARAVHGICECLLRPQAERLASALELRIAWTFSRHGSCLRLPRMAPWPP